jgi:hypothetical protein
VTSATVRTTAWVPRIGFAGALASLLLVPGLVVSGGETSSGAGLVRDAAAGTLAWGDPRILTLLVACGAGVGGLFAGRAPSVGRLLALVGLVAAVAFNARSGGTATLPYYAALAGFGIAFLGSRSPGCGPLG